MSNLTTLYFDIESHAADLRWEMDPDEFFRLGQYSWGEGPVTLTTSRQDMIDQIEKADKVVAHNGVSFDLPALYGKDSTRPLELAMERRVVDTMVLANLVFPSRYMFKMRPPTDEDGNPVVNPKTGEPKKGRVVYDGLKPAHVRTWLGLDNLCFQLGIGGKEGDLKKLAAKYAKEAGLKPSDDRGFGLIPVDDPDFTAYAEQDIISLRELAQTLKGLQRRSGVDWEYIWREMLIVSIDAQNSRNGWTVDLDLAQSRVDELAVKRDEIMSGLVSKYGFPTEGKAPWSSTEGKEAIFKILEDHGITEKTRPDWTKTATGNLSLGGETLIELTAGTEAEDIGQALAELKGQRSLAQLALDSVKPDGKVHPKMTRFQRSGRLSVQEPGLTVWTARGENAVEKEYFLASPGRKLIALDYSNADARIVAAYSGDKEYAKRFEPGFDSHELTGRLTFGDEVYDSNPKHYRNLSKPMTHGWGYRGGAKTLAAGAKVEVAAAQNFIDRMSETYPDVVAWQDDVTDEGRHGSVMNDWGRVMVVDRERTYTQSPALYGQSGTREIMCDALIRIVYDNLEVITWLVAQVHDELIFDVPETELWWTPDYLVDMMTTEFKPKKGGQLIEFPVSPSKPSDNWREAGH